MPNGITILHEKIILSNKGYTILAIIFIAAILIAIVGRKIMVKHRAERILGFGMYFTGIAMMLACVLSCSPSIDFSALEQYMGDCVKRSDIYEVVITNEADTNSIEELKNKYTILSTDGNVYTVKAKSV